MLKYWFSILVLSVIVCNEAARILVVVPTPAISHQVVFRPLTQELARRGHEVVVVTTNPAFPKGKTPSNLIEIDLHNVSYSFLDELKKTQSTPFGKKQAMTDQMITTFTIFRNLLKIQFREQVFSQLLKDKNQHFDLLILEAFIRPILALSHVFKAPVIQLSSLGGMFDSYNIIGAPYHPLLYPMFIRQRINNLSIWEKVIELYNHYRIESELYGNDKENEAFLRTIVGQDMPGLTELSNNVDMLFLNIHPIWDNNRPVPPGVVYMGGIHMNPPKVLPTVSKDFLHL